MFRARFLSLFLLLLTASFVYAQTPGNFVSGQVLGADQLNAELATKQDVGGGGGVGGSLQFANNTLFAAAVIPASINNVVVLAPNLTGVGFCPTNYVRGTSTPTNTPNEVFSSGTYWKVQFSTDPVKACEFGTVPDGSVNSSTNVMTGTDNTTIIQSALNYAMQNTKNAVCLSAGNYKTTDTIHLGWGDTFYDISLTSCSDGRAVFGVGGPELYFTQSDRCAINVQGGRSSSVKGIALVGQNLSWFFNVAFPAIFPTAPGGWLNPAITPTGTNPGGLQRYSPYGGICTDSYAGQPPSTLGAFGNYPNVTNYPPFTTLSSTSVSISNASPAVITWPGAPVWLTSNCQSGSFQFYANCPIIFTSGSLPAGLSLNTFYYVKTYNPNAQMPPVTQFTISATPGGTAINTASAASGVSASRQYGMVLSSNLLVQDSDIEGFAVNVNLNSSTNQAQNDFLKVERDILTNCVYCISVGNDQSRNVSINNIVAAFHHTLLTNDQFGEKVGELGGPISNLSSGQSYQFFDLSGTSFGFPITINDIYAEAMTRIGKIEAQGNSAFINGCNFNFGSNLLPAAYIDTGNGGVYHIKDCSFAGIYNRIDVLTSNPNTSVIMDGGFTVLGTGSLPSLNGTSGFLAIPVAYNYAGGLLINGYSSVYPAPNGQSLKWLGITTVKAMTSATTFSNSHLQSYVDFNLFNNRAPFTQATRGFYDITNQQWHEFAAPPPTGSINISTYSPSFTSCDTLTFNYPAANQAVAAQSLNINPGDILFWTGDGTIFVVVTVGTLSGGNYPVTAVQMNNMVIGFPGGYNCVTSRINDATLNGGTTIIHSAGKSFSTVTPVGAGNPGGIMIPEILFFGDFANGAAAVKNISPAGPTGAATNLTAYSVVGDIMWGYTSNDPVQAWPNPLGQPLAAVTNGTPGSITLGGAAVATGRFPISPLPIIGMGLPRTTLPSALQATLPTCAAGILGLTATITDSNSATPGAAIAPAGANKVIAVCNAAGPAWVVQTAL